MTTLAPCTNCRRHFRPTEPRCPFCSARTASGVALARPLGERQSRAAWLAFATASAVAACTPPGPTPDSPGPPPPAAATEPATGPATTPSAPAVEPAPAPPGPVKAEPSAPKAQTPPVQPVSAVAAAYGAPPPMPAAPLATAVPAAEAGPDVKIRGVSIVGGSLPNAERSVAAMQPGFRSCYARGLKERPDAEGDVIVKIRLGSAGQILGVNVQQTSRVPATIASCMATRAAASQFDVPPSGKGVEVVVPTTLVKP
jgi:hypothetical protein